MNRLAIFDCDGTLVDSEPLARRAWERSLAPYGYAIDDAEYAGLIGLPYPRVHGFFAERIPGLGLWKVMGARETAVETAPGGRTTIRSTGKGLPGLPGGH